MMTWQVHADGAISATSELETPRNFRLLPQTWNTLQLRCRDATGNASELIDSTRLSASTPSNHGTPPLSLWDPI